MISIIAAVSENNAIGFEGKLLYWLPADLKRFDPLLPQQPKLLPVALPTRTYI